MYRDKIQVQKTNSIAALYPSCKLWIVLMYSICSFLVASIRINDYPALLIVWFLVIPVLTALSGVFKKFLKVFSKLLIVVTIVFVAQSIIVKGGDVLLDFGFISVHQAGLASAIMLGFSITNIAGIFIWFFQTTENKEITYAMNNSGMNYKAAYVFTSSLQMVEVLGKSSKTIMNAQRARGVETQGNMIVRAKAFFPSLVPLILGAITNSEERVLTLESKGFDVNGKKTQLVEVKKSGNETKALIIAGLIVLAIATWRVLLWVL